MCHMKSCTRLSIYISTSNSLNSRGGADVGEDESGADKHNAMFDNDGFHSEGNHKQ